jgi:hypothetical protein
MNRNIITEDDVGALAAAQPPTRARTAGGPAGEAAAPSPPPPPPGTPTADDYWSRLLKYIPIEVIGAYLAATGAVSAVSSHRTREVILWVIFVVALVMTPIYLRNLAGIVRSKQLVISAGAFVVWAFALGGPFAASWNGYELWMGSIAVVLSAFVLGGLRLPPLKQPEPAPST